MSTVTSLSDLPFKGQRKVKLLNVSNDKSKMVNVLVLDEDAKVSIVTSLSDLWTKVKGQRKVKLKTVSNDKNNSVDVLSLDKHAKVSTVTSSTHK